MEIRFQALGQRLISGICESEHLGHSRYDQISNTDRGERNETDAIGEIILHVSRYLQTQARFADTSGTSEGENAYL